MDRFEFRKHLYVISNHLSTSEVSNMKFLCDSLIPRRQSESISTAFDLFCFLEGKNCISRTDVEFLEEVLDSVGKAHLIHTLRSSEVVGKGVTETRGWRTPPNRDMQLEKEYKKFLIAVSDELTERNTHDVALFFFDPSIPNLALQEIEKLKSANTLFQILQDNQIIGPTDLRMLRIVLETIGRKDVCKMIDQYTNKFLETPPTTAYLETAQHLQTAPTTAYLATAQHPNYPYQASEWREPYTSNHHSGNYSSGSSTSGHNSFISQPTDAGNTSMTLVSPPGEYYNNTSFLLASGPSSRSSMPQDQPQPRLHMGPTTHSPMTMQSDFGNQPSANQPSAIVHGKTTHLHRPLPQGPPAAFPHQQHITVHSRTAELARMVEEKDDVIENQRREIESLEKKLHQEQKVYRQTEIKSLRYQLQRKIQELESSCSETEQLRGRLLTSVDAPLYEMTSTPHGLAIIIVNEKFQPNPLQPKLKLGPRGGAENDLKLYCQVFETLKYKVMCYKNLKSPDMYRVIEDAAQDNHTNYDSFVCCISTHGDEHVMYGTDSVGVKRVEFDQPLKQCPTLRGKPKMFFIQACRTSSLPQVGADCPTQQTTSVISIPLDADVFIANATTARNPSYRSPRDGSWFVAALHHVFTMQAYYQTLVPMMYAVNTVVCNARGILLGATGQAGEGMEVAQCAEWTTSFRKGVRFLRPLDPRAV